MTDMRLLGGSDNNSAPSYQYRKDGSGKIARRGICFGERGRFESADGGTLFLDEIGGIPLEVQEKILRVVEYGAFERVGSPQGVDVDVRIIAATNADLPALAGAGRFKQDLLDRLSFEVIFLPPLRERKEDILFLANHFALRMAYEIGREDIPRFSEAAVEALEAYPWPGNVRELKNVVERAVYRADSSLITEIAFNPFGPSRAASADSRAPEERLEERPSLRPLKEAVQGLEVRLMREALRASKYNQRKAAKSLGLTYHQFRGLYRKYGSKVL
jgi:psp operon transcriptional activator